MADDRSDFCVRSNVRENPLADLGVSLHFTTLLKRQGARLLQESRREADLADVVNQTCYMRELLLFPTQPHPSRDIARVNGHSRGVTRRITIPGIKRRHKRRRERQIRAFKRSIRSDEFLSEPPLILVEGEEPLRGQRRQEEQRERPR
jgi:hypothetical protein